MPQAENPLNFILNKIVGHDDFWCSISLYLAIRMIISYIVYEQKRMLLFHQKVAQHLILCTWLDGRE